MRAHQYTEIACRQRRVDVLAPHTRDVRSELVEELSDYLGITPAEVEQSLDHAGDRFTDEWRRKVTNPDDERAVIRFYNESTTEIFELAAWHGFDRIHCRSIISADIFHAAGGGAILDYGSGIGSDALVFAKAGFDVTLADVSTPLLAFAEWRCRRHGCAVRTIDLKSQPLPVSAFDAAVCFDVLEHIRRPVRAVRQIHRAMRGAGLLFLHAPFGPDPERPMHLVHTDPLTARIRAIGFHWREDLQEHFPDWIWAPQVYERLPVSGLDRLGYYIHDVWVPGVATRYLARVYRRVFPNSRRPAAARRDPSTARPGVCSRSTRAPA